MYLYIRMFLSMIVSFFTSRVVLDVLGVEDYGIYNVVGGVVVLFTFLNATLVCAVQRFLNLSVGKGDVEAQQRYFAASIRLFIYLAVILIVLLETVGLWFLNYELNLPAGKYAEANVVYQISVASMVIGLFRIPYNAYILAQEKMVFYAYVSILESVLKLAVVFLLVILPFNKLDTYAFLYLIVTILVNVLYVWYCRRKYPFIRFTGKCGTSTVKEVSKFSGWMALAGIADMGYMQGTNIIVNIFCGVVANAAIGITNNLKNAVYSFVRNIMTAAQPQIMKSYASGDREYFRTLVLRVSKFAFFLFFIIAMPLVLNMEFVLGVWLKNYPPDTAVFCLLCLIFCMIDSLVSPLWTAAQIDGDIKRYQIVTGLIILMNVPLSYLFLALGFYPYVVFVIQIVLCVLGVVYRVAYLHRRSILDYKDYLRHVVVPILAVVCVSLPPLYVITLFLDGLDRFVITLPMILMIVCPAVLYLGMDLNERNKVVSIVFKRLKFCRR